MSRLAALVMLCAVEIAAPGRASADTTLSAALSEDFKPSVEIAGRTLVGLAIGAADDGVADPRKIRIPIGGFTRATGVCLTLRTRDGQYRAEAALTAPTGGDEFGTIDPHPSWRYLDQLARYPRSQFAAVARFGRDCDIDPEAPYLPIYYDRSQLRLSAALNLPRLLSSQAWLRFDGGSVITGACRPAPQNVRAVAFNVVCRFDLTNTPRRPVSAQLMVSRHDRAGDSTQSFPVWFPL